MSGDEFDEIDMRVQRAVAAFGGILAIGGETFARAKKQKTMLQYAVKEFESAISELFKEDKT